MNYASEGHLGCWLEARDLSLSLEAVPSQTARQGQPVPAPKSDGDSFGREGEMMTTLSHRLFWPCTNLIGAKCRIHRLGQASSRCRVVIWFGRIWVVSSLGLTIFCPRHQSGFEGTELQTN